MSLEETCRSYVPIHHALVSHRRLRRLQTSHLVVSDSSWLGGETFLLSLAVGADYRSRELCLKTFKGCKCSGLVSNWLASKKPWKVTGLGEFWPYCKS